MLEEDSKCCHITALPTEILLSIFTYLNARDLIKCRQVCLRWKGVIDGLQKSELLWREHCRRDYPDVYKTARYKAQVGLLWYNIYKSLSLWPRLSSARELRDEFAPASVVNEEIMNFQVLQNGIIGVHRKGSICYYDLETLEPSRRSPITGNYLLYAENTDTIIILAYQLHLHVIRKVLHSALHTNNTSYLNVKTFLLQEREVYYANLDDEIYVINLDDETLSSKFIRRFHENVMCIGHSKNCLNVLTFEKNIYSINDVSDIVIICPLDSASNLLHTLNEYNFLEHLDWRVYFQWMYVLQHTVPHGPLRDIIVVRIYGDIVFVGSNWGVLRIYYSPYSSGEFDLYSAEPVKQYNFMERQDCPVLSDLCPVIQIDVLESEDGHTVLAAMPKKIAIIEFVHNFKRTASVAMLPYRDVQRIKILKIDDTD